METPTLTSLSDAYTNSHLDSKHIIPLDFSSIHTLPESHTWTNHNSHPLDSPSPQHYPIPIIDLTSPNLVNLIKTACQKIGTFQLTNHRIPSTLITSVENHARLLFSLPTEQKLKALRQPNGATGYGVARISPFFEKQMWHEGFTIIGSPIEHSKQLFPDHYEDFCYVIDNYQKKMKSLAYKLTTIILEALGVEDKDELGFLFESEGALQLNSYPSCPDSSRAVGLAPHTDSLLLTILHQNDTKGLQILEEGVGWVTVPPIPGALVVNIGDLMHIISNARFHTVMHRVIPNETRHRYTVGYFYGPPADSTVAPPVGAPIFRAVTVKEYIGIKNEHLGKALDFIKIKV